MTKESPFLTPSSTSSLVSLDLIDLPLIVYRYSRMKHIITTSLIVLVGQQLF